MVSCGTGCRGRGCVLLGPGHNVLWSRRPRSALPGPSWSSQPKRSYGDPSSQHTAPRIAGKRPLEVDFEVGPHQNAAFSLPLAVTLFELTVVNNWYIIMVRARAPLGVSSHQSWGRPWVSPEPRVYRSSHSRRAGGLESCCVGVQPQDGWAPEATPPSIGWTRLSLPSPCMFPAARRCHLDSGSLSCLAHCRDDFSL